MIIQKTPNENLNVRWK